MDGDILDAGQRAMQVLALVSAPMLIPALVVGVVVGIVQAATSVNEATLSFIPKAVVVGVCAVLFAGMIGAALGDFTREMFAMVAAIGR
jgi:flagellar biosynthesis protein FliQ